MIVNVILLVVTFFLAVLASLLAGSETGIYQLSRVRLRINTEKRQFLSVILSKVMDDSSALLISILIGLNLAYYIITSIVTYLLMDAVEDMRFVELIATVLTAPLLFVLTELIPKNIFFYRADSLMPYAAPVLITFQKLFTWCGITGLLKLISSFFSRLMRLPYSPNTTIAVTQKHQISVLFKESQEEGFLSDTQTDLIRRLGDISNLSIRSVMTNISRIIGVDINSDKAVLLNTLRSYPFTRLPVFEHGEDNIIGFINIYEALSSSQDFDNLRTFIKPIHKLPAKTIVLDAISIMQNKNEKIVLVTKAGLHGKEKGVGIVTMKDLVEELIGELSEW